MKAATRPEDIRKRAFRFAVQIVRLCHRLDQQRGGGRALSWQLLRSGTSIGANLEEAQAAQSRPDFISKNNIALKEARETVYWLRLLIAADLITEQNVGDVKTEAEAIARIIGAIVVSAKRNARVQTIASATTVLCLALFFPFAFFLLPLP